MITHEPVPVATPATRVSSGDAEANAVFLAVFLASATPAEVGGYGTVDAADARDLAAAAARDPRTRRCITGLHPAGTTAAHGCAPGRHPPPPGPAPGPASGPAPGPDPPPEPGRRTGSPACASG
jgi:hypothetical protein